MKIKITTLALTAILFCCNSVYSLTCTWVGGTSNTWTNTANWSPATVPTANDTVIINSGSTYYPILAADVTAANAISTFYISGGALTMNGFDLTCDNSMTISGGTFNVGSGLLNINGELLINGGILNVNTGDVDVFGDIAISSGTVNGGGSTSSIYCGNVMDISGGTFNAGSTLSATTSINIKGGTLVGATSSISSPLLTLSSGTFTKTTGTFTVTNFIISGGTFTKTSTGTVIVGQDLILSNGLFEAGDGTWVINGDLLMSGGVLNANTSSLKVTDSIVFCAGTVNAGTSLIDANNTITICGGTVNANTATLECADLNVSGGTLNIAGNKLIVNDNITLCGGNINISVTNMYVPDDFIITSGILDLNNFDLTVANDYIYEGGDIIDPGTFYLDNFIVDHSGTHILDHNINIVGTGSVLFVNGILKTSPTAMLTFSPYASVSGADNSSHVAGPCRKQIADTNTINPFVFPIGNGVYYAPIIISGFQNARSQDYFTAQYDHASAPYNHAAKDTTLDHISDVEYWALDRGATSGTPTTIAFVGLSYITATRSGGVFATHQLRVARWDDTAWRDLGGNVAGNTIAGVVTSSARVSEFSPFTLASTSIQSALPVSLLSFQAMPLEKQVKVSWSTSSEIGNDFFTVQKCLDGKSWSVIGIVDGVENSTQVNNYTFMDKAPVNGIQYYRLIQTDINGNSTTSDIVSVNLSGALSNSITLYPNPIEGMVNITLSESSSNTSITIFNSLGMKVMELNNQSGNLYSLDMTSFEKGIYTIEVHHDNGANISKILKN